MDITDTGNVRYAADNVARRSGNEPLPESADQTVPLAFPQAELCRLRSRHGCALLVISCRNSAFGSMWRHSEMTTRDGVNHVESHQSSAH